MSGRETKKEQIRGEWLAGADQLLVASRRKTGPTGPLPRRLQGGSRLASGRQCFYPRSLFEPAYERQYRAVDVGLAQRADMLVADAPRAIDDEGLGHAINPPI